MDRNVTSVKQLDHTLRALNIAEERPILFQADSYNMFPASVADHRDSSRKVETGLDDSFLEDKANCSDVDLDKLSEDEKKKFQ